jgi:hypothetical protein
MNYDEQEPKNKNVPLPANGGFEDADYNERRLIQGTRAICIDGKWSTPDGVPIPTDKKFIGLSTAEAVQHWQDGTLIEQIVKKPGGPPLPNVKELNSQIPEKDWDDGINGKPPPWVHQRAVYFLDPVDGSIFTACNSTDGMNIAVNRLKDRVRWMRALRGSKVSPILTLGARLVSRRYQKYGPDFVVVEWRDLDLGLPEQTAPRQLEDRTEKEQINDRVESIGRPVDEPSMAEILDDKIPEDDWQPPGESMKSAVEKVAPQEDVKTKAAARRTTTKCAGRSE